MDIPDETLEWLLEGDPAVRWQTKRDLLDAPPHDYARDRGEVEQQGWGRALLDVQDPEDTWAQGLYGPKWVSTTYTLLLLRRLGLEPGNEQALKGCARLWDGSTVEGGLKTHNSTVPADICITAMFVMLADYFGYQDDRLQSVLDWMVESQMDDGGWNCAAERWGSSHGSYHTSIQVLECLAELDRPEYDDVAAHGREFFLDHRLYKSHRTGEISHRSFTMFSFPPRWFYDVLRGLDYFQSVAAPLDDRLDDALELLTSKQRRDGYWPVQNKHSGRVWFDLETGRNPSRINTLRALRVLRWAESGTSP